MTRDSGLDRVLHSLRDVVRQGQEVQLFIMAGGPAERYYRRLTEQLNIRSQVTFAGPMGDWTKMSSALRGADFYILPASRRRFTISTLLAMADGLAILAPQGTIGDYLVDGQTAFLFDIEDPRSLTERWMTLLTDRTEARRLAHRALDFVRSRHKASTMVNRVTDFYRKIRHTFT
jgi:glycosyltransferase involved in cell wall biosynthesis